MTKEKQNSVNVAEISWLSKNFQAVERITSLEIFQGFCLFVLLAFRFLVL